ncbi:MAG: hypothetical protein LAQ69_02635 [Acidobacteriia bacterium]|nr:hypothetical protein [Terriglobia bacterium]
MLTAHLTPYDGAYRAALERTTQMLHTRGSSLPDAARQAHGMIYGSVMRQSGMLAFADAFWVMAVLFVVIVPLMFLMNKS